METMEPVVAPLTAGGAAQAVAAPRAPGAGAPARVEEGRPQPDPASAMQELTREERERLDEAIGGLNRIAGAINRSIRFRVFEDSGRMMAQVVNTESGEVIKTIPPIELLRTLQRIDEAIGLLIDEKA